MAIEVDKITIPAVRTVAELIRWGEMFQAGRFAMPQRNWAFRGQPKDHLTLLPSFPRAFQDHAFGAAELIERELIAEFRKHYALLPDRSADMPLPEDVTRGNDLYCLSVMQHYEVPTRLLDWSSDFWVAVYFACATEPSSTGELWFYDRTLLSEQPDLSSIQSAVEARVGSVADPEAFGRRAGAELVEYLPRSTPRMRRQDAHHTVAGNVFADHAQLLNQLAERAQSAEQDPHYFRRILIHPACKGKVLQYLADHKQITASTIFPDVVGLGRFLRWQFESLRTMLL